MKNDHGTSRVVTLGGTAALDGGIGGDLRDAVGIMLPWATSLLVHLGIVVIAMTIVWAVVPALENDSGPIIPIARIGEDRGGGPLRQSSVQDSGLTSTHPARIVQPESVPTGDAAINNLNDNVSGLGDILIGVNGPPAGEASGLAFGSIPTPGSGLGVTFGGLEGNAEKICYVVDASGSLIDTLPFVIRELKRSISELKESQQYTVIFFQSGEPVEVPPRGWKPATAENRRETFKFIDLDSGNIVPRGRTDPVKAIKLALKYEPELMFLLSDNITGRGEYEMDREEFLKFLNDANKARKTKINTIQFMYTDTLETLKAVADEHGGRTRFVSGADLGE